MTVEYEDRTAAIAASDAEGEVDARETRKLAAQVAARIEGDILAATWPVGRVLG